MSGDPIRVGIVLREQDLTSWSGRLPDLAERAVEAGLDHLTVGDHVSFADGHGADGLIQAAALLSAHPSISIQTGVYLLALRHPAIVARQLATIAQLAPGRLTFGIGVGGDDPRELELCGIDPRLRGRSGVGWHHALQLWAGFGASRAGARTRLSAAMEAAYSLPFERFERYAPCGPPAAIAEALMPYLAVGCRWFNFVPEGLALPAAIKAVSEVKTLLTKDEATSSSDLA